MMTRHVALCFAVLTVLTACGIENEPIAPPPEYARGVEILAQHGIVAGSYFVQLYDPPLMLDGAHVGGYVANLHHGIVAIETDPCPASTSILHELLHVAHYRNENVIDWNHERTADWEAVAAANAEWGAEACLR